MCELSSDNLNSHEALQNSINLANSRIDQIASLPSGSTSGDAELMDIRIGADGTTYTTAGKSVRTQISNCNDDISRIEKYQQLKDKYIKNPCEFTRINLNMFDIYLLYGYVTTNNGVIQDNYSTSHSTIVITDTDIDVIKFPVFSGATSTLSTVFVTDETNTLIKAYPLTGHAYNEWIIDLSNISYTYIYICWWGHLTTSPYFDYIDVKYKKSIIYLDNINNGFYNKLAPWGKLYNNTMTFKFSEMYDIEIGFMTSEKDPVIGSDPYFHRHITFPADGIRKLIIDSPDPTTSGAPYAIWRLNKNDDNGVIIIGSGITHGEYIFDAPPKGIININVYYSVTNQGKFADEFTLEFWSENDCNEFLDYMHSVRRSFDFSNKHAIFVGDSITRGYTSAGSITENGFPKLFSNIVGMTFENRAVGGALFVSGLNEIMTIPQQVQSITTAPDFLFISGGINDWQLNANLSTFRNTISNLCDYCIQNFPNTEIIWILPIKHAGWETSHPALAARYYPRAYAKILYNIIKSKDQGKFSIVNGSLFGFPDRYDDTMYIQNCFGDLLHPSEIGYKNLYTPGLLTALC